MEVAAGEAELAGRDVDEVSDIGGGAAPVADAVFGGGVSEVSDGGVADFKAPPEGRRSLRLQLRVLLQEVFGEDGVTPLYRRGFTCEIDRRRKRKMKF